MKTRAWAVMAGIAVAFAGASAHAGAYRVIGGAGEMCADLAQWANGKPSQVRPVAWTRVADLKPSLRAEIRHLSLDDGVTADAVYVVKQQGRRDLVFVNAKHSTYDYRDNLVFAADGGRQACFVNGAIYGNRHCQDFLHEQLPDECHGCDDSFEWRANWRMKTELLTWRGGVYAADIIANGPYIVLWKSPDGFYGDGDVYWEVAHCVLKR